MKILFVYSRPSSFIEIDRQILAERWQVQDRVERRPLVNPLAVARDVWRCDLVFGWFAYWHTFWPITLAWLMGKPSVLVIGGYDTANMPDVGYGLQQGGFKRMISRWTMKRAGRLITNSHASQREIERNVGLDPKRVTVVHHGLPDPFGELPAAASKRTVLTVGVVDRPNLVRKGLRSFVEAAAQLPDTEFVLAGRWDGDAIDELRRIATENVRFTGWISQDELDQTYRSASVYVQASAHEGFGMSVAETMLAGCIPVVSTAGALPEVVGDVGIQVPDRDTAKLAEAIEQALTAADQQRQLARQRVLENFTIDVRREGIQDVVEQASNA